MISTGSYSVPLVPVRYQTVTVGLVGTVPNRMTTGALTLTWGALFEIAPKIEVSIEKVSSVSTITFPSKSRS